MSHGKVPALARGIAMALACWLPAHAQVAPPDLSKGYPGEIALNDEGAKGILFRRFPGGQRLYIYDQDGVNRSNCNLGCDGARPPVYVACTAKPMPDWTVVQRYNGLCQWAYKGHPLYTYFHDTAEDPRGDGEGGVWHLLGFMKKDEGTQ